MRCVPVVLALFLAAGFSRAAEPDVAPAPAREVIETSTTERILGYIPNRLLDLADLFRLRLRVGPGLAANLRLTDYGSFYAGSYSSLYLGLPGPRYQDDDWWPVGVEQLKGFALFGVDATDDTRYGPRYSPTEMDIGAHLLLVGADVGFDPMELVDFFCGLFLVDIREDDYMWRREADVETSSAISIGPGAGPFRVEEKPEVFGSWTERLDYLASNVPRRVDTPIRTVDEYFAPEGMEKKKASQTKTRIGLYAELVEDEGFDISFEPDFEIEVDLPNIERRMKLFVESGREDDLPGRSLSERDDQGVTIGVGEWMENLNIMVDAGIRTRIPPELFARLSWRPRWSWKSWKYLPEQRVFWESNDKGFGSLTQLGIYRWIGEQKEVFFRSQSAGKINEDTDGFEWEQTLKLGRVKELIEEDRRGRGVGADDLARGYGIRYSLFGEDTIITEHRFGFGWRFPVYQRWLFADIKPGLEWKNDNDFETAYRLDVGIDVLFWGAGYR